MSEHKTDAQIVVGKGVYSPNNNIIIGWTAVGITAMYDNIIIAEGSSIYGSIAFGCLNTVGQHNFIGNTEYMRSHGFHEVITFHRKRITNKHTRISIERKWEPML